MVLTGGAQTGNGTEAVPFLYLGRPTQAATGAAAQSSSLAFIPFNARTRTYGTASWYPVDVAASPLCASGCSFISGDTVYQDRVMGLYIPTSSTKANTYLAPVTAAK